jgi:adenine-specific DNA-methyltransferase
VEIKVAGADIAKKFLLAYLQSSFCNWYAYNLIYNRAIRTMHFINYYITQIPIPKTAVEDPSCQEPFITFVDKILVITKDDDYLENQIKQSKVREYEKQIDRLVYELYGLTQEEIKIVESK